MDKQQSELLQRRMAEIEQRLAQAEQRIAQLEAEKYARHTTSPDQWPSPVVLPYQVIC